MSMFDDSIKAMGGIMQMSIAQQMLTKAMKFGDKTYALDRRTNTKRVAQSHAKKLKKKGYGARIKKGRNKSGKIVYGVYRRKK